MKTKIDELIENYPSLKPVKNSIMEMYNALEECYKNGNKLLVCGNGGSCTDAEHIVGELMKGFKKKRPLSEEIQKKLKEISEEKGEHLASRLQVGLPAMALDAHVALNSAFLNDVEDGGYLYYAQEVMTYGNPGDVFLGISTSGNSKNIIYAAIAAKSKGLKVIELGGKDGGELKQYADIAVVVPMNETYRIQELHMPIYHAVCLMLEDKFFEE